MIENLAQQRGLIPEVVDALAEQQRVYERQPVLPVHSSSQFWALQTPVKEVPRNPYTYQEVYDRLRFYDRQEPIDAILRWLEEALPTDRLILHGQRRVGKTSLAKYLIHEILPERSVAQPVWIDFQDLTQFTAQSIVHKLILEPVQRAGMLYEETLPAAIMALTNGNPYLIQVLCHELLQRVIKLHRMNVTADDLNHVVNLFTSEKDGSRIFHHFVHYLKPVEKIILAAIAHSSSDGDWVNIADVLMLIRHKEERLPTEVLSSSIKELERQGILALRSIDQKEQIRIPFNLFCNYVAECIDIQGAIEEWKTD